MEVVVELGTGTLTLAGTDDLGRFSLVALGTDGAPAGGPDDRAALAAALGAGALGSVDGDGHALVAPDAVRALAAGAGPLPAGWDDRFTAMLGYAATKGWITDDGLVRAHIEWKAG